MEILPIFLQFFVAESSEIMAAHLDSTISIHIKICQLRNKLLFFESL